MATASSPPLAAKSRRPFCFRRLRVIWCPQTLSASRSPAALAEGGRSPS